jgi:hypothetical protein
MPRVCVWCRLIYSSTAPTYHVEDPHGDGQHERELGLGGARFRRGDGAEGVGHRARVARAVQMQSGR